MNVAMTIDGAADLAGAAGILGRKAVQAVTKSFAEDSVGAAEKTFNVLGKESIAEDIANKSGGRLALPEPKKMLALPAPEERLALPTSEERLALPGPEERLALPEPEEVTQADVLNQNRTNGKLFEESVKKDLINSQGRKNIVEQVTIKTKEGIKVRADFLSIDEATGNIIIEEAKSSMTAPLTKNQKIGFPQIETGGATVVGKGKPPFTTGVEIAPTEVKIIRPDK